MDTRPSYIRVDSILEFSRLVCALERIPRVSFLHKHKGESVLSAQMDIIKDKPVIYFAPVEKTDHYLSYGLKGGREDLELSDSAQDAARIYSPIIRVKALPKSLREGNGTETKYHPLELDDMASLAKLSFNSEEMPFPLFSFPHDGAYLLGLFLNFNEDGESYFCYVRLDSAPAKPFLRITINNGTAVSFAQTPSDHGYSYIKIIRLRDTHPMIDYEQLCD